MGAPDLIADAGQFFAPVSSDLVDGLIGQYRSMRSRVENVAELMQGEMGGAVSYFLEANSREHRYGPTTVERLFELKPAIAALNAAYWSKAINMTDVLDAMPQGRRDEWNAAIRDHETPEFDEETVRATLQDLLLSRSRFFAERVDGIFRALSGEHVTNSPAGFRKRMILTGITNAYYSTERVGYINDLRCVIAKFMGRDEPAWNASGDVVRWARSHMRGQWVTLDGGALKIRCYDNGNAHVEVHPDMAWRLNCVLAQMHPNAIPAEFRQKPKKKLREFEMIQRPLPFAVLRELCRLEEAIEFIDPPDAYRRRTRRIPNTRKFSYGEFDKHARNEVDQIIAAIGGALTKDGYWQFDYEPGDVISEIIASGCVPDQKSHQFYPTPQWLAEKAVELAEIGPHDMCLEPSAGTGGIADLLPSDRTVCVEISQLHCKVLEAKGFRAVCADFLSISQNEAKPTKVVMNPPFDQGRWIAHLNHASDLLTHDGRLVAILPASAKSRDMLPGWTCSWHGPLDNAFPGVSVSVVILVAEREI